MIKKTVNKQLKQSKISLKIMRKFFKGKKGAEIKTVV